jgi:2-amino-4-hydroxy-6-hydroxymethyldihydropteridine diphosphokinase
MQFAVGVGSNLGDRADHFAQAESELGKRGLTLQNRSSVIETEAVGGPSGQDRYLNAVWIIETDFGPHQLLTILRSVEIGCGRTREVPNGPRTLDLDLLMERGGLVVDTPVLKLPHPRMAEREFVLRPLAEVAGEWVHPGLRTTVAELLRRLARPFRA